MDLIKIIEKKITRDELQEIANERFGDMVKGVVDITKEIMALGGELHADEEAFLIREGSEQKNLWGINLYPQKEGENFIEFDSVINIRPSEGNRSRGVEDTDIQKKIIEIVNSLVL